MAECKIDEFGDKYWYENGTLHREAGPAVEWITGDNWWYKNGKLHNDNGPAIEYADGYKEWRIKGKQYSFDEYCIKLYGSLDHQKSIMLQVKYS